MSCDPGPPPDPANVQGLILRGYTHRYSTHMLFRVPDRASAAKFVEALLPLVQSGANWGAKKPCMMLNIGFTVAGLRIATALDDDALDDFPAVFCNGPTSDDSQLSLCDFGDSNPANWWAKNFEQPQLHCVVHAYALDPDAMKRIVGTVARAAAAAGVTELFGTADKTRYRQADFDDDRIQFGYRDGISDPLQNWPQPGAAPDPATLPNFLIGYPCSCSEPGPAGDSAAARFAKDGCYNAFRIVSQDVAGFEAFLTAQAPAIATTLGIAEADAREWLAAKLVGRWRNGSPLEVSPDAPDEKTRQEAVFEFGDDKTGAKCPLSSHIRVSNPRDQKLDVINTPPPRLARRGMPYGPWGIGPGPDRGLIGLFLCGALDRQFEKIYHWLNVNDFSPLFGPRFNTQDAVLGNRGVSSASKAFSIPTPKGTIKIAPLPQFLTTRGTAYCLLPSLASLRAIAAQSV
jgi:deferrochelatase/peroxidase EfeB